MWGATTWGAQTGYPTVVVLSLFKLFANVESIKMSNCRTSCCVKDAYLLLPEKAGENNVQ